MKSESQSTGRGRDMRLIFSILAVFSVVMLAITIMPNWETIEPGIRGIYWALLIILSCLGAVSLDVTKTKAKS